MADLRKKRGKTHPKAPPLTEAERVFCAEFLKTNDKNAALKAAWPQLVDADADELKRHAHNVTRNVRVKREMERLREAASANTGFAVADALEGFLAVWRADPNEVVRVRVGNCRYCNGHHHAYQWTEREYVEAVRECEANRKAWKNDADRYERFPDPDATGGFGFESFQPPHPDCPECGGEGVPRVVARDTLEANSPLYAGVKMTKYGPEVLLHDRMAALEKAARIVGAFEDRIRIKTEGHTNAMHVNFDTNDPNVAAAAYKLFMQSGAG